VAGVWLKTILIDPFSHKPSFWAFQFPAGLRALPFSIYIEGHRGSFMSVLQRACSVVVIALLDLLLMD